MATDSDRGFTLIELLLVVAIISIIAALAVPGLLRARMTGNETTAIASLRVTSTSQVAYSAACGNGGNATSYLILGTPLTAGGEAFISADLGNSAAPLKSGYSLTLGAGAANPGPADCLGRATFAGYYATATPLSYGSTGTRAFAVNLGSTVWQSIGAAPPSEPFAPSATVSPIQ